MQRASVTPGVDRLVQVFLRCLYTEAVLPAVTTLAVPRDPDMLSTVITVASGETAETRVVAWRLTEYGGDRDPHDVIEHILRHVLPWLDTRLTRCEPLKDVDVFTHVIYYYHSNEAAGHSQRGVRSRLAWHKVILVLGLENARLRQAIDAPSMLETWCDAAKAAGTIKTKD